jgi:hypothetical protein
MKRITTLSIILINTIFLFGQSINDSLLIHYDFNGNANDLSGNNFNGNVNATPTDDRFGNSNSAYSFNGINEFIDLPSHSDLKPQLPVTISTWVKFDDIAGNQTTIFTNDFASDNHTGVWINTSSTGLFAANYGDNTGNTSSGNRRTKLGETILQAGEWYHLTAVVRGPQDMDLYINCENDGGTYNGSGGQLGYSSAQGSIGRKDSYFEGPAWYFAGNIDDFKYWSRDLSEEEIIGLCRTADIEVITLEEDQYSANIFPNPSNNSINIQTDFDEEYDVNIFTLDGKMIKNINRNGNIIDVSALSNGTYFIKLSSTTNISFQKSLRFVKI